MYRLFFCFVVVFLIAAECEAAGRDSVLYAQFNIENGLPSNYVYSTIEDSKGYMWFSTDRGIVKYNGHNFTTFNTSSGLPSDDVWYLTEDSRGRLWPHTYSKDIGYIKDDKFHKINFPRRDVVSTIKKVYEKNGYTFLWVHSDFNFLCLVDSLDRMQTIRFGKDMYLYSLFPELLAEKDSIHVRYQYTPTGLRKAGACRSLIEAGYFFFIDLTSINTSISVSFSSDERAKKLLFLDGRNCSRRIVPLSALGASEDERLYLVYVKNDVFFIITNRSVIRLDKHFKLLGRSVYSNVIPESVQLTHQLLTAGSNQWLSTKGAGCLQVYGQRQGFTRSALNQKLKNPSCVGVSPDGTVWWYYEGALKLVGSRGDGVDFREFQLPDKLISLAHTLDGKPLACIPDNILELDFRTGASRYFFDESKPVFVNDLQNTGYGPYLKKGNAKHEELLDGRKWAAWWRITKFHSKGAGNYYYLTRLGLRHLRFDGKAYYEQTLDFGKYDDLIFDRQNNKYWVYNQNSIMLLDPDKNTIRMINNNALESLGISTISQIVLDSFSNMYVYDRKKILIINTRSLAYKYLPINANLSDARLVVTDDMVTVAGKFGVAQAKVFGPLTLSAFSIVPNIRSQHYNLAYELAVAAKDSLILVNTDKGIFRIKHPIGNTDQPISGHIVLSRPFQHRFVSGDTIRLDASVNQVSFDYINYYGKGNRLMSYSIAGSPWKESSLGEMSIVDLQPGVTYQIKCRIKDDMLESRLYTFYLYKIPFWYQTPTWRAVFWVGGVLLFLLTILIAILITRNIIARANAKRSMQVELELRAIHSQINPHFIFNTLSSAQYFIYKKDFEQAYAHINKFSKLLRLYLKSSRNRYTALSEEIDMLCKYIDLQKIRFEGKFTYTIEIDKRIPSDSIQIPSLLLQPLVENAINHGLFHRQTDGGLLQIRFSQGSSSDELLCHIEDNGVGREKAREIQADSEVHRSSYGTKLTEELIELFEKYEKMNIGMQYIDKAAPETGTIVKLTLRNMKYVV